MKCVHSLKNNRLDLMYGLQMTKSRFELINRIRIKNKKYINYDFGNYELRTLIKYIHYLGSFA